MLKLSRRSFWGALAAPLAAAAAALVRKREPAPAVAWQWISRMLMMDLLGYEPRLGHTFTLRRPVRAVITPACFGVPGTIGRRVEWSTHTIVSELRDAGEPIKYAIAPSLPEGTLERTIASADRPFVIVARHMSRE